MTVTNNMHLEFAIEYLEDELKNIKIHLDEMSDRDKEKIIKLIEFTYMQLNDFYEI